MLLDQPNQSPTSLSTQMGCSAHPSSHDKRRVWKPETVHAAHVLSTLPRSTSHRARPSSTTARPLPIAAATISLCGSRCLGPKLRPEPRLAPQAAAAAPLYARPSSSSRRRLVLVAATEGKKADQKVPSWARPGSDEAPPWARGEAAQGADGAVQVPFYAYLLASAVTAIAAIGSIFEYTNGRAVFGVVGTDSPFYAPILGFFAVTGIPTSGYLWYMAVQTANKDAEEQDRRDGFL